MGIIGVTTWVITGYYATYYVPLTLQVIVVEVFGEVHDCWVLGPSFGFNLDPTTPKT